jgi:hypothetical protein
MARPFSLVGGYFPRKLPQEQGEVLGAGLKCSESRALEGSAGCGQKQPRPVAPLRCARARQFVRPPGPGRSGIPSHGELNSDDGVPRPAVRDGPRLATRPTALGLTADPPPYNSSSLGRARRLAACLGGQPGNPPQPGSALLADLGFKRQSVPSSCHVDQNGLHSRIWRTLRHLPTLSSAFSTLDRIHNPTPPNCLLRT